MLFAIVSLAGLIITSVVVCACLHVLLELDSIDDAP